MKQRSLFIALSQVMIASVLLGACAAPAAVPTATLAPAPTAVVFPTTAPTVAAPTVAPTTAAATEAATAAATAAATTAAATAAPTTAAATAAPTAGTPVKGGTLTIVDNGEYSTLDPFKSTWNAYAAAAVYDPLVAYNPQYSGFVGILASDWKFSADNKQVTFTLRDGLKYQDGTAVDATSVKWNFDRYIDKTIASPASDVLNGLVTNVAAPDAKTVVLTLSSPFAPLFDTLGGVYMVSPTAFQKVGADNFGQTPTGTGPWVVKEQIANDHRTFTRNPDYTWDAPYFDNKGAVYPDEYTIKYLGDDATVYSALETGQVQVAPIPPQFLTQARANSKITIVQGLDQGIQYIGFNTQYAPLDDKNIRQAIGYAINRSEVIKAGFSGEADEIYGPLAPTEFGYSQDAETLARKQSFSVDTAKSMFTASGYALGSDGVFAKDGKKLEFRFIFPTDDPSKRMAETIQSQLADAGVKLDLAPEEVAAMKDETVKGTHQMFLLYMGLADPRILCFQFCSENINGTDRTRFKNDDLDKALTAMNAELDPTKRDALVDAAEKIIIDQRPEIPLMVTHHFFGYRNDQIAGLKFDVLGNPLFNDAYLIKP